MKARKNWCFVT